MSQIFNSQLLSNYYNNTRAINKDHGDNEILHSKEIITPSISECRKDLFIVNTNKMLLDKILNKKDINHNDVIRRFNSGGGNCYYNCIIQFFIIKKIIIFIPAKK